MAAELANLWWALILLGLGAGIISGLLGVGSGIVVVPALVFLVSFPQKSAQGTALAVMVPMALVGVVRYWVNPEIELNLAVIGLLIPGALIGAFIGAELAGRLPAHVLRKLFAIFILIVGVRMLVVSGKPERAPGTPAGQPPAAEAPTSGAESPQ